jgi:hypothetical protein
MSANNMLTGWKKKKQSFIHHFPTEVECDCIYTTVQLKCKKQKQKKMKNTITKKKYSVGCYHKECGKGESQLTESN